jgi:hypothetical protein
MCRKAVAAGAAFRFCAKAALSMRKPHFLVVMTVVRAMEPRLAEADPRSVNFNLIENLEIGRDL